MIESRSVSNVIKTLGIERMPEASKLIWKSFYQAEKNNFSPDGIESFRNMTEAPVLQLEILTGKTAFYGSVEKDGLLGVIALREDHVVLLFVRTDVQKRGIGSALLRFAAGKCKGEYFTVNSAPSALGFYEKIGFTPVGACSCVDGIISTPMRVKRSDLLKASVDVN